MQQKIGTMAKRMYFPMILMGFMIVMFAFVIGYINSQTASAYFAQSKILRETTLMAQRASIESTGLWLPYFKFLGFGLLLGGIVMALRVIIDSLLNAGKEVMGQLPEQKRPQAPNPPWYAKAMPLVMMAGELIFIVALFISIQLAGAARAVFANPLQTIDTAGAGSALLLQLQTIQSTAAWLVPFKFLALSTEFVAIAMGLSTIIYILKAQTQMLDKGIDIVRSSGQVQDDKIHFDSRRSNVDRIAA